MNRTHHEPDLQPAWLAFFSVDNPRAWIVLGGIGLLLGTVIGLASMQPDPMPVGCVF